MPPWHLNHRVFGTKPRAVQAEGMRALISRKQAKAVGLLRYYTGVACRNGHLAERSVCNAKCVTCRTIDVNAWKKRNPIKVADTAARYHKQLRAECLALLGSGCSCCHESEPVFLCIDHRGGGGNTHRRSLGIKQGTGGARFFKWLLAEASKVGIVAIRKRFRILCHNCNAAHGILGHCPHHPRRK